MATVTSGSLGRRREEFTITVDAEEAVYIRDVMATEWGRAHDYGAKELADALTRALAR